MFFDNFLCHCWHCALHWGLLDAQDDKLLADELLRDGECGGDGNGGGGEGEKGDDDAQQRLDGGNGQSALWLLLFSLIGAFIGSSQKLSL